MTDDRATTSLRRMLLLTVSPVICVFAAGTAFAQSPARDYTQATAATGETGTVMLGEVVVAGSGGSEESIEDGNTVAVVDYTEIETFRPQTVRDLFRREPAVSVGGTIATNQKVYVHGIEETNLAVSIDGARQNNKLFHHNATNVIDPRLLKAARVDAGVAAADAGPGALAGAIAYETVDVDDLLRDGRNWGGFVEGGFQTNGDTFSTLGAGYARSNGFEVLGFLNRVDGDDYEDGDGRTVTGTGAGLVSGLGKVAYEGLSGDRFEFSYERVTDDGVRPYRANIGSIIGGRPVPDTRIYDLDRQNVVFSYENTQATGWFDPKVTLAYSTTNLETEEDILLGGVPSGNKARYEAKAESFNATFANEFHLEMGSVNAGVDVYRETADFYDATYSTGEKADNIGAFAQARLDPTDKLSLSFGGRIDHQVFTGTNGGDQRNTGASGNASAKYALTDHFALKAGVSSVFGGIVLAETFIQNPAWIYTDIDPVRGDNGFAGFEFRYAGFMLDGQLFRTDIENGRTPDYRGGPSLTHDFTSTGFDLTAGYDWGTGNVRGGFTSVTTEMDGNGVDSYVGNYFTVPMGEIFTLALVQRVDEYGLTFGADAEFALEEDAPAKNGADPAGVRPLESYAVVNAFVEYVPPQLSNVTLRAKVDNIFDETYSDRATYGQEFSTVVPLRSPGRSFGVSARIEF